MGAVQLFTFYNMVFLARALATTVALSLIGCGTGLACGFCLALVTNSRAAGALPLRLAAMLFIGTFRRVPFLVTLFLVFFGTQALHAGLSLFSVALVSVCLIASAYLAEIIRAGLAAVRQTEVEAALVMNLSALQRLVYVVLPQAWKVILPPAFAFFVLFIKDTALASQIGLIELTYAGKVLNDRGFPATLVYATILVLYFLVSYPLAFVGAWLERRLAPSRNR